MRAAVLVVMALSGVASADPFADLTLTDHAGVHVLRFGAGLQLGRVALRVVVDPFVVLDAQHTLDALAEVGLGRGIAAHAGWRDTAIGVDHGVRMYDSAVVGVSAPMLYGLRAGLEVATLVAAHGAELPVRWGAFGAVDSYAVGLFVEGRHAF
jgi:hypothetical protein